MAHELRRILARQLRLQRALRGWSQEALALGAEINRTHLGAIERAELSATIDTLEKIAKALDMQPHQLLKKIPIS